MSKAWLMIAAGENRQHGGNLGYEDDPQRRYSWDNTVANHQRPVEGDFIALWDKKVLLGVSVIDRIDIGSARKVRLRCPGCSATKIKVRHRIRPNYRCHNPDCRLEFDKAFEETIEVKTYSTDHEAGWVSLPGVMTGAELRRLCLHPASMHSIRELNWLDMQLALEERGEDASARLLGISQKRYDPEGHTSQVVRVRRGQASFRRKLLEQFGEICAFTGPQPQEVLEAAHLYSYAVLGRHFKHGGLLLRRDLHRLFDLGLISIDPDLLSIDVASPLARFDDYQALAGQSLRVSPSQATIKWLKLHWEEHRGVGQ